jgi:hypothetical protein
VGIESALSASASRRVAIGTGKRTSLPGASGNGGKDGLVVAGWHAAAPVANQIRPSEYRTESVRVWRSAGRIDVIAAP